MDFRKELYNTISPLLLQNGIRHVDLWNHNVEFIEQEQSWERPAVFIEFAPVRWNAIMPGVEYRAEPEIRLHIVTDWQGCTAATGGTQPTGNTDQPQPRRHCGKHRHLHLRCLQKTVRTPLYRKERHLPI